MVNGSIISWKEILIEDRGGLSFTFLFDRKSLRINDELLDKLTNENYF